MVTSTKLSFEFPITVQLGLATAESIAFMCVLADLKLLGGGSIQYPNPIAMNIQSSDKSSQK